MIEPYQPMKQQLITVGSSNNATHRNIFNNATQPTKKTTPQTGGSAPVKSASTEADNKVRVQRRKLRAEIVATSHVKGISNIATSKGTLETCRFSVKGGGRKRGDMYIIHKKNINLAVYKSVYIDQILKRIRNDH